jgi:hypothetical protein
MIPSPQTNNRYLTYSCWLAARHSQARIYPLNSQLAPFIIRPRNPQRIQLLQAAQPNSTAKSLLHPSRSHLVSIADVPKPP